MESHIPPLNSSELLTTPRYGETEQKNFFYFALAAALCLHIPLFYLSYPKPHHVQQTTTLQIEVNTAAVGEIHSEVAADTSSNLSTETATEVPIKNADKTQASVAASSSSTEVVSPSPIDKENTPPSQDHTNTESSPSQPELAADSQKPKPHSGISLLESALSIARETTDDETETGTERFDRRLTQAIKDAEIYNQPGTYSNNQITSYTDHTGRQFVKVGNRGCFELVDGDIGLQEGKVWYFSDECPGQQDKPVISFEHIN